jgi:hypothetical protein
MSGTIGVPGTAAGGDGSSLWLLDGDKLTLLRTFGTGGFKAEVTINGSSCSLRAVMVREEGAGATRRADGVVGGPVTVLSMTPTGSTTCRITLPAKKPGTDGDKKPEAGDEKKPAT